MRINPTSGIARRGSRTRRLVVLLVLLVILATSTILGLLHQLLQARPPVVVDAFSAFRGIKSLWTPIATGTMVRRMAWSTLALLGAVALTSVLFRRSFCGSICPLGTLGELLGRLGRALFGTRYPVEAQGSGGFDPKPIIIRNSLGETGEASGLPLGTLQRALGVPEGGRGLVVETLAEAR